MAAAIGVRGFDVVAVKVVERGAIVIHSGAGPIRACDNPGIHIVTGIQGLTRSAAGTLDFLQAAIAQMIHSHEDQHSTMMVR